MSQKTPLKNRSERPGNLVSIEAYDQTSRAYSKERNQRPQINFSAYLTIAVLVFLVIFFIWIYELIFDLWGQIL